MPNDRAEIPEQHSTNAAIDDLLRALTELKERIDRFRLRHEHFTGDLTLWSFLAGVWESANATLVLVRDSDLAVASYANARAAIEAAEDALLLATEPEYDEAGAKARVFERLEHSDIQNALHTAFGFMNSRGPETAYKDASQSIANDARRWDADYPGKGKLLLDALNYFRPKFEAAKAGKRHPAHWSEMSRRRIAEVIGKRLADPEIQNRLTATYAVLSRNSHPRFRAENWKKNVASGSGPLFQRPEFTRRIPVQLAEISVKLAIHAVDLVQPL